MGERSQNLKPSRAPALVMPMFWQPKSAFEITRERANLRLGGPEFDTAVMDGTPKKARMVAASAGWRRLTRLGGGDANCRQPNHSYSVTRPRLPGSQGFPQMGCRFKMGLAGVTEPQTSVPRMTRRNKAAAPL